MKRLAAAWVWLLSSAALGSAAPAFAQEALTPASTAADKADPEQARQLYKDGLAFVQNAQWAEALVAFEASHQLRPHPLTLYNIGACERALGRYSRALATLRTAVELGQSAESPLSAAVIEDANRYIAELTKLLAHLELTIEPSDATVAVDLMPLTVVTESGKRLLVAGRRPPGAGEPLPEARADVVLDPGAHVLTVSRKGFADRVINKTFAPGSRQTLVLNLDKLPASLHVSSDQDGAAVRVNALDVGLAPVEVTRPAGNYRISVAKNGFNAFETSVSLRAGEHADIRASLKLERPELYKRWWFWTAAAVVVGGAAVGTYYATRPEPQQLRPPLETGGLGWNVKIQ